MARGRLPIAMGLVNMADLTDVHLSGLAAILHQEFRSHRRRFPHSPLVLLTPPDEIAGEIASTAAADIDVTVLNTPCHFEALARICHVVIMISRENTDFLHAPPAPWDRGDTHQVSAVEAAGGLEPDFTVQLIQLVPGLEGATGGYSLSRFGLEKTAFGWQVDSQSDDRAMRRTEDFNRDAAAAERSPPHGAAEVATLSPTDAPVDARGSLRALFATADALAKSYQARLNRVFLAVFLLAAAAAMLYGVFLTLAHGAPLLQQLLLAPYLLLLLIAYAVFYRARRGQIHDRFSEYRTFAEGIRVQRYWLACGIHCAAADHYLIRHPAKMQWIRLAMRLAIFLYPDHGATPAPNPQSAENALRQWIADQRLYYAQGFARSRTAERRARILVLTIFGLGGGATLLVLFQSELKAMAPYLSYISLLSFLCPSVAAGVVAFINKLGLQYRVEHYFRMLTLYSQVDRHMSSGMRGPSAAIAVVLGREALRENSEWVHFRLDRGVEEPASPFRRPL
jgi:hypothetical protein